MTEVEQQPPPQNGIDLRSDEDENNITRPADIEQDMREMDRRKRVEAIMGSKLFREELERIVDSQIREGGASGILQQLSDIVGVPASRVGSVFKSSNCVLPINDIRGIESMGYAKGEKILRCKLAATFRLLDLYGWTQGLGAQITARLNADQELFLVNPFGLLFHEVTASSLNKVDMQGNVVEQGTTNFGINNNHYILHSVVHSARPDIRCAIYLGCNPVVAVSSLKAGILPLTKDAALLGEISTHPYTGALHEPEEREKLVRSLGPISKVLLLNNHGAVCCGETIEEAFFAAYHIVQACETQLKLLPVGLDNLVLIPEESRKAIYDASRRPPDGFEAFKSADKDKEAVTQDNKEKILHQKPKWRVGGAEYEALMRMLDNAGFRTGYIYRHPLVKSELPKPKNDVEVPPAVSSLGYLLEEEELYRQGIWKKGEWRKGGDRTKWLNSPNVYQKVEVLETGTPDPKKITKWVADGSPTHSNAVRIEHPLQFVPVGTNPKEFKRLQQQIKDNRRADKISAGPQSHILEGVTWDEANRIKENTVTNTGDHVVLMGAASKGIIQRGYQHNATVYKAPYAKNPFDNVTDDELNEYKKTVEKKKKNIHGEYTDTDFSESEALSSLPTSGAQQKNHGLSQSEPEDASEHQVMRIETKQAPKPSQPEVVLSDATHDFLNLERAHAAANKLPPTGREISNTEGLLTCALYNNNQENQENNNSKETPDGSKHLNMNLSTVFGTLSKLNSSQFNNNELCLSNYNFNHETEFNMSKKQEIPFSRETFKQLVQERTQFYENHNLNEPQLEFKVVEDDHNGVFYLINFDKGEDLIDHWKLENLGSFASIDSGAIYDNSSENYSLSFPATARPYRTASHFGFNDPPFREPKHKHYPTIPTNFRPLLKDESFDEIFASKRYANNCSNCFHKMLTQKCSALSSLHVENEDGDDKGKKDELDNNVENLMDCQCEGNSSLCLCSSGLEPLSEHKKLEEDLEETPSFFDKILKMNYTDESLNPNFRDFHDSTNSKFDSLENRLKELSLDEEEKLTHDPEDVVDESCEKDSGLKQQPITRSDRIDRKEKFSESSEDHFIYFRQRNLEASFSSEDSNDLSSCTNLTTAGNETSNNQYSEQINLAETIIIGDHCDNIDICTKKDLDDAVQQNCEQYSVISQTFPNELGVSELLCENINPDTLSENDEKNNISEMSSDDFAYRSYAEYIDDFVLKNDIDNANEINAAECDSESISADIDDHDYCLKIDTSSHSDNNHLIIDDIVSTIISDIIPNEINAAERPCEIINLETIPNNIDLDKDLEKDTEKELNYKNCAANYSIAEGIISAVLEDIIPNSVIAVEHPCEEKIDLVTISVNSDHEHCPEITTNKNSEVIVSENCAGNYLPIDLKLPALFSDFNTACNDDHNSVNNTIDICRCDSEVPTKNRPSPTNSPRYLSHQSMAYEFGISHRRHLPQKLPMVSFASNKRWKAKRRLHFRIDLVVERRKKLMQLMYKNMVHGKTLQELCSKMPKLKLSGRPPTESDEIVNCKLLNQLPFFHCEDDGDGTTEVFYSETHSEEVNTDPISCEIKKSVYVTDFLVEEQQNQTQNDNLVSESADFISNYNNESSLDLLPKNQAEQDRSYDKFSDGDDSSSDDDKKLAEKINHEIEATDSDSDESISGRNQDAANTPKVLKRKSGKIVNNNETFNDSSSSDSHSDLNSIESLIIQKIKVCKLKRYKDGTIFNKIEDTIRNKITPSKLEDIVSNETFKLYSSTPSSASDDSGKLKTFLTINLSNVSSSEPSRSSGTPPSFHNLNIRESPKINSNNNEEPGTRKPNIGNNSNRIIINDNQFNNNRIVRQPLYRRESPMKIKSKQSNTTTRNNRMIVLDRSNQGAIPKQSNSEKACSSRLNKLRRQSYTILTPNSVRPQQLRKENEFRGRLQRTPASINVSHNSCLKRRDVKDNRNLKSNKRNFVIENIKKCSVNSPKAKQERSLKDPLNNRNGNGYGGQPISGVYAFQNSHESRFSSPRLWISLPSTSSRTKPESKTDSSQGAAGITSKKKLTCSRREELAKERTINRIKRGALEKNAATNSFELTESVPGLNNEINDFGSEIRYLDDGIRRYMDKTDLCLETVRKAAQSMNEVIAFQNAIEESHHNLRQDIIAERAQQEICMQLLTSAISEDED